MFRSILDEWMRSLEFALNGVLDERARRLLPAAECKCGDQGAFKRYHWQRAFRAKRSGTASENWTSRQRLWSAKTPSLSGLLDQAIFMM